MLFSISGKNISEKSTVTVQSRCRINVSLKRVTLPFVGPPCRESQLFYMNFKALVEATWLALLIHWDYPAVINTTIASVSLTVFVLNFELNTQYYIKNVHKTIFLTIRSISMS